MRGRTIIFMAAIAATASVSLLAVNGHADRRSANTRGVIGPDVICWTMCGENSYDVDYRGTSGDSSGYSVATQSCNWGDEVLNWYGGTNNSPVIMQNLYRLKDGRFEQIGIQSFMKHSFCALSEPGCGSCQATNCDTLGIGCADTYWAGLNSGGECPRSDVNGFTGDYPYPFTLNSSGPSALRGNLIVPNVDINPADNPGARYFFEAQYVAADDMQAGNGNNNASWREVVYDSISSTSPIANGPSATNNSQSAIEAWKQIDSSVRLTTTYVPDEGGKVVVGTKVFDNGDGTYDYEYAVYNMNSDRSIRKLLVPTGSTMVSNLGFHDVNYSEGEIYDGTDWAGNVDTGMVYWNTDTFADNDVANAIRWGTMYNFRFTATGAPEVGQVELGVYKSGGAMSYSVSTYIPAGDPIDPCDLPLGSCPEDVDGDGVVAVGDLLAIVADYGECGDGTYRPAGDVDGDCCITVSDILAVVNAWGNDCTPIGACCLPEGGCLQMTEEACSWEADGTYQGNDTDCATADCPSPGACCFLDGSCDVMMATKCITAGGGFEGNDTDCETTECPVSGAGDECSSAMIASYGGNEFETYTATPSDNPPDDSQCGGTYLDWENSPDIWFRFDAKKSGTVQFTTCDASSYDTSMALYESSCDNQVACNGDSDNGSGCQDYFSAIDHNVESGSTYYIRIGGWQGGTGDGTLTIE
jgi:hypothetical protein